MRSVIVLSAFFCMCLYLLWTNGFFPDKEIKHYLTKPSYENYKNNTVDQPSWPETADEMVLVDVGNGVKPYFIDRYEAVISQRRAWSVPNQYPVTRVTYHDAIKACAASGKRLCTTQEWQIACRDGSIHPIKLENTDYMLNNCDFGRSKGFDSEDHPALTNSHPNCASPKLGIHHMIGNVVEMTWNTPENARVMGLSYLGTTYYGAAFKDNPHKAMRMACEYTVLQNFPDGKFYQGLGFRCCKGQ